MAVEPEETADAVDTAEAVELPFRTAAELNINLVGAANRSAAGQPLSALEHIVAIHERLPESHPVTTYVEEHLTEDAAAVLVVEKPDVFRFRCREAQQFLDVETPDPEFNTGGVA